MTCRKKPVACRVSDERAVDSSVSAFRELVIVAPTSAQTRLVLA